MLFQSLIPIILLRAGVTIPSPHQRSKAEAWPESTAQRQSYQITLALNHLYRLLDIGGHVRDIYVYIQ